mmetsp:Transcript_36661/g.79344  ORF Transcript_36661/g.79344 Transcript_36661/m.79344 type:complete len:96 (-) Transcript_36661:154-441(-)
MSLKFRTPPLALLFTAVPSSPAAKKLVFGVVHIGVLRPNEEKEEEHADNDDDEDEAAPAKRGTSATEAAGDLFVEEEDAEEEEDDPVLPKSRNSE